MKNNQHILLIDLPRICLVLFVLLQIISMMTYSGGTLFNPDSSGYSFSKNFLSDLGRYQSWSLENNFIACQLFNMSILIAGGVFTVFYTRVHTIFVLYKYYRIALLGSLFGVLGSISLAAVGLTPADLYPQLHDFSAKWLFRSFFIASICYSLVIFKTSIFKNKYATGYIVFAISILVYILISELGPNPFKSDLALTIQVISQKIILIILFASVYLQTKGLEKISL